MIQVGSTIFDEKTLSITKGDEIIYQPKDILDLKYITTKTVYAKDIIHLAVNHSNYCNKRCSYCILQQCGEDRSLKPTGAIHPVAQLAETFNLHNLKMIDLTGGEPLAVINEIIAFFSGLENYPQLKVLNITTNGTLLNDENYEKLIRIVNMYNFIVQMHISYDGTKQKEQRGYDFFEDPEVVKNIRKLQQDERFHLCLQMTQDIETVDFANELNFIGNLCDSLNLQRTAISYCPKRTDRPIDPDYYKEHATKYEMFADDSVDNLNFIDDPCLDEFLIKFRSMQYTNEVHKDACFVGPNSITVDMFGNVLVCDEDDTIVDTYIGKDGFMKQVKSREGDCPMCEVRQMCQDKCFYYTGYHCTLTKMMLYIYIRIILRLMDKGISLDEIMIKRDLVKQA